MSISEDILAALAKASGPLTSSEVAEQIEAHATAVGRTLYAMARENQVEQVEVDGKPAFLAASGNGSAAPKGAGKAARKPAAAKRVKPPKRAVRKAAAKKVAKRVQKRQQRPRHAAEHAPPIVAQPAAATRPVTLQHATLRVLLAFVFASERPLDVATRNAAADAAREAA